MFAFESPFSIIICYPLMGGRNLSHSRALPILGCSGRCCVILDFTSSCMDTNMPPQPTTITFTLITLLSRVRIGC